ncbi:MAG: hypothetical protein R2774_09935 [Saprospiraceae bacterium]
MVKFNVSQNYDKMKKWKPITENELIEQIHKTETDLIGELWNFWQLIRIDPEKWQEPEFGNEGGGFWVVAICGKKVIWYNDIEEGFNISDYKDYRNIEGYYCNQDELKWSVMRLYDLIKSGGDIIGQAGPPQSPLYQKKMTS